MKRRLILASGWLVILMYQNSVFAQCSICTKTAQQLGEGPAQGMNTGILYLAFLPFAIIGIIAYRWWKQHKQVEDNNSIAE